jgi:hypothetical protein
MVFKILADMVVLAHFVWILFLLLGAFWGTKSRTVKMFHISGLLFAFLIHITDWYCPLTYLEVWLRSKHAPSIAYTGSFIIYYVEKIIYLEISHFLLIVFTILLCGTNGWLYFGKKSKRHHSSPSRCII